MRTRRGSGSRHLLIGLGIVIGALGLASCSDDDDPQLQESSPSDETGDSADSNAVPPSVPINTDVPEDFTEIEADPQSVEIFGELSTPRTVVTPAGQELVVAGRAEPPFGNEDIDGPAPGRAGFSVFLDWGVEWENRSGETFRASSDDAEDFAGDAFPYLLWEKSGHPTECEGLPQELVTADGAGAFCAQPVGVAKWGTTTAAGATNATFDTTDASQHDVDPEVIDPVVEVLVTPDAVGVELTTEQEGAFTGELCVLYPSGSEGDADAAVSLVVISGAIEADGAACAA